MAAWDVLFAGQRVLVEYLVFAAADQARMTLDTSYETVAVAGNGKSRERPEGSLAALGRHRGGALESNDG